jgi:hypothetical protein
MGPHPHIMVDTDGLIIVRIMASMVDGAAGRNHSFEFGTSPTMAPSNRR